MYWPISLRAPLRYPVMVAIGCAVWAAQLPQSRAAELTAEAVAGAIQGGIEFLEKEQRPDGSWPEWIRQPGGVTALCTLALLNSGVKPDDDHIQRALFYLRKQRQESTYSTSLVTMVLARAEPIRDLSLITQNVRWLENNQVTEGETRGSWSYPGNYGDNSNSQFALLALHEAERVGVKASGRTWALAKDYWEDCQNVDGSWGYRKAMPGTGSMTCAGITSLVIAYDRIRRSGAAVEGDLIQCCQPVADEADRLAMAIDWMGRNFQVSHNPRDPGRFLLYYLYGLERVGRLTAQRFLGGHDWYREGADHLVRARDNLSGYWRGVGPAENDERIGTALSLLFLSKGRWPVLLAKLEYGSEADWNQHPADVNNLTRFVESQWGLDLTWQVVDFRAATADDLMQSPVLYLGGQNSPLPGSEAGRKDVAGKLRDYLDRGGFLFAEANCNGAGFDQGFRQLMELVFPEPEYRLQLLPPEHPVWRAERAVEASQLRPLLGIDFGCRTSVVYSPPDESGRARPSLSCLWELSRSGRDEKYSVAVQSQIDAGLSIGANVLAYATNRELKFKDEIPRQLQRPAAAGKQLRGQVFVANVLHPGGCNAAPRALTNLLETAAVELGVRTVAENRQIALSDPSLFDYHMVFMHGRTAFRLTDAERKQLKTFVERGGMVLADAICASQAFAGSFRREMEAIFPGQPLQPIAAGDPLLGVAYGGFDLSKVSRRDPQRDSGGGRMVDLLRQGPPELEAIAIDGRYRVIFSPYDLSCALEKQNSLECQGYVREDAARIGLNVLLYSLQQ